MARGLATRLASFLVVAMLIVACDASFGPPMPNGLACANVPPEVCLEQARSLGFGTDPSIIAVASDEPLPGLRVPVLDLDDVPAVAALILERLELECRP